MESSRPPGGGWEIFLLLQTGKTSLDIKYLHWFVLLDKKKDFLKTQSQNVLSHYNHMFNLSLNVKKGKIYTVSLSPSLKNCSHLRGLLCSLFGEVSSPPFPPSTARTSISSSLRTKTMSDSCTCVCMCVCVYIQHVALKIMLTGQPATALWQRRPAPSAVWPACA